MMCAVRNVCGAESHGLESLGRKEWDEMMTTPCGCLLVRSVHHVVPDVSWSRSRRTVSLHPNFARWYATDVPMMPPPHTTTRADDGIACRVAEAPIDENAETLVTLKRSAFAARAARPNGGGYNLTNRHMMTKYRNMVHTKNPATPHIGTQAA